LLAAAPAISALLRDAAATTRVLALWPKLQTLLQRAIVPLFTAVTAAPKQSKLSSSTAAAAAVQAGREHLLLALQRVLPACEQCNSSSYSISDVSADVAIGESQFTASLLQGTKSVMSDAITLRAQAILLQWLQYSHSTSAAASNSTTSSSSGADDSLRVQFVWHCVTRAAAAMRTAAKLTAAAAAVSNANTSKTSTAAAAVSAAAAEAECALTLVCTLLQERNTSSSSSTPAVELALTAEAVSSVNAFFTAALKYRLADALALDAVRLLAAAVYDSDSSDSSSTSSLAAVAAVELGMWSAEDLYARTVRPLAFALLTVS
jgi:hypothetical protein